MIGKILEIHANDAGQIVSVRYLFSLTANNNTVESEGNCFFQLNDSFVPLDDVTEEMIVQWIVEKTTKDGVNAIESRLEDQLQNLEKTQKVCLPWNPKIFTMTI